MSKSDKVEWSAKVPTEPGFYWYYGRLCGETDKEPEWVPVQIRSKTFIVMSGHFLSDYEPLDGLFCRAVVPEAPVLPHSPNTKKP